MPKDCTQFSGLRCVPSGLIADEDFLLRSPIASRSMDVTLDDNRWLRRILSLLALAPARPSPEACNPHLAELPAAVTDKIAFHIADPFDRATLAMTCRLMAKRLASYKSEFALFRKIGAERKRLDYDWIPFWKRNFILLYEVITSSHWISPQSRKALDQIFQKLDEMYPRIPERVFHETWLLFSKLKTEDAVPLLKTIVPRAAQRSPLWAIEILRELAYRWRSRIDGQLSDALLELALPFWLDSKTTAATDEVIGHIARNVNPDRDLRDEARWKKIVSLLPQDATASSKAVLGLTTAASIFQYRWNKYGDHPWGSIPAVDLLRQRIGQLPSWEDTDRFSFWPADPEQHAFEKEVEMRRHARYLASAQYAKEEARYAKARRAMAWGSSISCGTAGGGC